MERIWLNNYSQGVPAEINPDIYQSLIEVFDNSCQKFRHQPAFYNMGVTLTYDQIDQYSRKLASYFHHKLKLQKGGRCAIMLPNLLQYPIAMLGILRAGLIVVNVNPLYTVDELSHQLNDAQVETIIVLSNFASTVQNVLSRVPTLKNIIITHLGDLFPELKSRISHLVLRYLHKKIPDYSISHAIYFKKILKQAKNLPSPSVSLCNEDIAFLQYTGGTTGVSKGAILTHRNIISNLQQADVWLRNQLIDGQGVVITALPLYHIFSLTANCLFFNKKGLLNVLITNPRDIPGMIKEMKKFQFTVITGVNTLFNGLLKDPGFEQLDFSQFQLTIGGGMAVQRGVAEKWQTVTGVPLLEAYGLTETSPVVSMNPSHLTSYNGTIGLPVSSTDVCILDNEGNEVPIGQPGELAIKGPQVMKAYWQNPDETAKVFTKDKWLLTGDIASIDDQGFIRILERKKDMILVSGFNVYPNEIENVLSRMPGIRELAVIGVMDENSGEAVKACIVKDNPNITTEDVISYCREHLTGYKIPKHVEFRNDLPKTNVGKILRRSLRNDITI